MVVQVSKPAILIDILCIVLGAERIAYVVV